MTRRRPDPADRPDPYELAIQRAAAEPGADRPDGTPPLPRLHVGPFRVGPLGLLVGFLVLVLGAALVRFSPDEAVPLPSSCTTPALALSADRVRPGGLVRWTAVGPDGTRVRLQVADQVLPEVRLSGCRAQGRFGVQAPTGAHTVVLLGPDGRRLAAAPLTVTELGDPTG